MSRLQKQPVKAQCEAVGPLLTEREESYDSLLHPSSRMTDDSAHVLNMSILRATSALIFQFSTMHLTAFGAYLYILQYTVANSPYRTSISGAPPRNS